MATTKNDNDFADLMGASVEITINKSSLDNAIEFIGDNLSPEDVFKVKDLQAWAESNGYTK